MRLQAITSRCESRERMNSSSSSDSWKMSAAGGQGRQGRISGGAEGGTAAALQGPLPARRRPSGAKGSDGRRRTLLLLAGLLSLADALGQARGQRRVRAGRVERSLQRETVRASGGQAGERGGEEERRQGEKGEEG